MTPPEHRLVVLNMSHSVQDISQRFYLCPSKEEDFADGFVHWPAQYAACYVSGGASYVAQIAGCVRLKKSGEHEVLWKFGDTDDSLLIERAVEAQKNTSSKHRLPCLVFLFDRLMGTELVYDSKGGMQSSRIYFDLAQDAPVDLPEVATKLRGRFWSTMPRWKV